jgi:aldehyde:ferredoxin oxidoreductase
MRTSFGSHPNVAHALVYTRGTVDLSFCAATIEEAPYHNLEGVLGGFGRSFQILAERNVTNAYSPENPLIINTGILTGSNTVSALRTFFSAYSPLKTSGKGLPGAIWSAGNCKFGYKFKCTGVDELIVEGRANEPVLLMVRRDAHRPVIEFKSAAHLIGLSCHDKIMTLHREYPDAHFAVIGPAGEKFEDCYFAGVAFSTENQFKSGAAKCAWAGRGGMGSLMGYKNLIAIVAQAPNRSARMRHEISKTNGGIAANFGSPTLRAFSNHTLSEGSFVEAQNDVRTNADYLAKLLFSETAQSEFFLDAESCFRCTYPCYRNVHKKKEVGRRRGLLAKFDCEPASLLSTKLLGVDDPYHASILIGLVDQLGMDAVSLGMTLAYVLEYNERHPDDHIFNGAKFGDFEKIKELVEATGRGRCPGIGQGVKRLSQRLDETGYAMQCKGVELPGYLPATSPGYAWAIADGQMSMATHVSLALRNDASVEHWANAIAESGLHLVRNDILGLCTFATLSDNSAVRALEDEVGLDITEEELLGAVRRAFFRALWLERKQGYERADYSLPAEVFNRLNTESGGTRLLTRDFFSMLSERMWSTFDPEIAGF